MYDNRHSMPYGIPPPRAGGRESYERSLRLRAFASLRWAFGFSAQLPQHPFDGADVAPVDDPLAVAEDDQRDDLAAVALAPFLVRLLVRPDVPYRIGDPFPGEITFHLGAVASAAADVNGDGRVARSAGGWLGRSGVAEERICEKEEGDRQHPGGLPLPSSRGDVHVRILFHRVHSHMNQANPTS